MTDTSAPTLFTRVTGMVAKFIDWIGGREPLAVPRAFYRKAQRHLCVIEDMLRGALYILALDITVARIVPKPVASVRVTRETRPPLLRKTTLRVGLFNIRPVADRVPLTPSTGPRSGSPRARVDKPGLTTVAFLHRISRIEAAMADPDTHAVRLARHLAIPEPRPKPAPRPKAPPRQPSVRATVSPRSILCLQPRWPPG
ncbi:MAG: hypothetical protein KKC43_01180 [Alphaproteobacteria bacterium]|nr:hypothetical protein [Alphaproteobacteria bacterium]